VKSLLKNIEKRFEQDTAFIRMTKPEIYLIKEVSTQKIKT